jgi:protein-disulfide isomerase-like protein with CxxC motif
MISSNIQKIILRSLMAFYADDQDAVEKEFIVKAVVDAGLAPNEVACRHAIDHLLNSSIITNGHGSKVSLSGGGLILGMGVRLSPQVEKQLHESYLRLAEEANESTP